MTLLCYIFHRHFGVISFEIQLLPVEYLCCMCDSKFCKGNLCFRPFLPGSWAPLGRATLPAHFMQINTTAHSSCLLVLALQHQTHENITSVSAHAVQDTTCTSIHSPHCICCSVLQLQNESCGFSRYPSRTASRNGHQHAQISA